MCSYPFANLLRSETCFFNKKIAEAFPLSIFLLPLSLIFFIFSLGGPRIETQ